jgi:hypothetical protein
MFRIIVIFVPAILSGCASATLSGENDYALNIFSGKSCDEVYSSEYGGTVWDKCWWNQNVLKIVFWVTVLIIVWFIFDRMRRKVTDRLVRKYKEYLALERTATELRYNHNALLNTREAAIPSVSSTFLDQCLTSQRQYDWARGNAVTTWKVLQKEAQRRVMRLLISGDSIVSAMNKALYRDADARFYTEYERGYGNEHLDHRYSLLRDLELLVLYGDCIVSEKFFLKQ